MVFTLDDYVSKRIMTPSQKEKIIEAVYAKKNILIVGGPAAVKRHWRTPYLMKFLTQWTAASL